MPFFALQVSQNFSGTSLTIESGKFVASDVFVVTGTSDPGQAASAVPVQVGSTYRSNEAMFCFRLTPQQSGPNSFTVTVSYSFGDPGAGASSPLNELPSLTWRKERITLPRERDLNGNAILNSAGDPFDPPATRIVPCVSLIVQKWIPFYDVNVAISFNDHVNSNQFTVAGAGGVDAGTCYCDHFEPIAAYTLNAPYVKVEYKFIFQAGAKPWQFYPADKGSNGWFNDANGTPQKGPICDISGNIPGFDVLLDGTGKPLDSRWYIFGDPNATAGTASAPAPQSPVANPSAPNGLTVDPTRSSSSIKTLMWGDVESADFSALGV